MKRPDLPPLHRTANRLPVFSRVQPDRNFSLQSDCIEIFSVVDDIGRVTMAPCRQDGEEITTVAVDQRISLLRFRSLQRAPVVQQHQPALPTPECLLLTAKILQGQPAPGAAPEDLGYRPPPELIPDVEIENAH
jgi:hypothetical protein